MNLDTALVAGLAVPAVFAGLALAFPRLLQSRWLVALSLVAAGAYWQNQFLGFLIVSTVCYGLARWVATQGETERRWNLACLAMVGMALVFTFGRLGNWERIWQLPIGRLSLYTLGMWQVLRIVSLFWEIGSGSAAVPSIQQYFIWTCLPFTLGGPLLRWSQMPTELNVDRGVFRSSQWWRGSLAAWLKITGGFGLAWLQQYAAHRWPEARLAQNVYVAFIAGPIGFYLSTAGQFHWMEQLGRTCGVQIPESFRNPIGRENISAFWMNWNMTVTLMFRDYLFYNRWGRSSFNMYVNAVILFTLVGLWHSANAYWLLWGIGHGVLFSGYLLWRRYGANLSLPFRGTVYSGALARVGTYFCVAMMWYLPSKVIQKTMGL